MQILWGTGTQAVHVQHFEQLVLGQTRRLKRREIKKNGSSAQFWIEDRSERASNLWGDTEGPLFSRIWQRTTISLATGWGNPENGQITSIDRREERKTVSHSCPFFLVCFLKKLTSNHTKISQDYFEWSRAHLLRLF